MSDPLLQVLFVDDEPRVLQGLQRMLRPLRNEWDMRFVDGGAAALAALAERPADVVISDMRMPGMSGAELLLTVMKQWPSTVRIILSGHADQDLIQRTVGPTHQYLQKPCDADTLKLTVMRASHLRQILADDHLRELVAGMDNLPSLPSLYLELIDLMRQPGTSLKQVGEVIARDFGMSMKILQLVNSAFFGLKRNVASAVEATSLLGMDTIQALVLSVQAFSKLQADQMRGLSVEALWDNCMTVSALAKCIALRQKLTPMQAEEAFIAGMMHDAGRLVLATRVPDQYAEVARLQHDEALSTCEAESRVLGTTHAEVGAYLLGLWGISDPVVEAVAFHHHPQVCLNRTFSALTCVHVADALVSAKGGHMNENHLSAEYLNGLGCAGLVTEWVQLMAQPGGG